MALIKCPECKNENVSDEAKICPYCGYPFVFEKGVTSIKHKKKAAFLFVILIVALLVGVTVLMSTFVEDKESKEKEKNIKTHIKQDEEIEDETSREIARKVEVSKENISPYLECIGNYYDENEKILLSGIAYENYKNKNVDFMGIRGEIEFETKDTIRKDGYFVIGCSWISWQSFTEDEFRSFANELNTYFDSQAEIDSRDYVSGHTYRYYWVDPTNDYYVTYGHGLFAYHADGTIEIRWTVEFRE